MASIKMKQGEYKTVTLTYKDSDGNAIAVDGATFTATVRHPGANQADLFTVSDGSFDKTNGSIANGGIILFPISDTNSNQTPGTYILEVKAAITGTNIDKSDDIEFIVEEATT